MDGVCDRQRLSQRLSQAEGVTEVWLFGEDSFKECPLTPILDPDVVVSPSYVQLGKVPGPSQFVHKV